MLRKLAFITVVSLALGTVALTAKAQQAQPTAEQLRMLQQLPAEQRKALIEQFAGQSAGQVPSGSLEFPDVVVERDQPAGSPEKTGGTEHKPFGKELFDGVPTTFAPATDVPVPPDYVLGPGDTVNIQLYGKDNAYYSFEVSRDGILNVPELGPVGVVGLSFDEFRNDIRERVANALIGTNVSVSMGQLRSIRAFVLGDVNRPGSYTVSGLSTMTHALFVSGGISSVGSMRNIQLKRNGEIIETLDLYELLLSGDTSKDARLSQGDVLFVPPIGTTIDISGAVRRPAIYELKDESTVADALELTGGLLSTAFAQGAQVERISADKTRVIIQVDASTTDGRRFALQDGDELRIPSVLDKIYDQVELFGHVYRPGAFAWYDGMRLTDLLGGMSELQQQADLEYLLIRREAPQTLDVELLSANLKAALQEPESAKNIRLHSRDRVYVFKLGDDCAEGQRCRSEIVRELLDEQNAQARSGEMKPIITVGGQVRAPGSYPLEQGMTVSDAIRAAAGLNERAYVEQAELVRFNTSNGERRVAEVLELDLQGVLRGNPAADVPLQPYDNLHIKVIPQWSDEWTVSLEGEFNFPGNFTIHRGETLRDVLDRAGGLTNDAFPSAAILLREELREREQQSIADAAAKLRSDLASLALESAAAGDDSAAETIAMGNSLLSQLQDAEATGRLVLPFDRLVNGESADELLSLEMRDGDRLLMPGKKFEVTVIGEVQQPTSHLFEQGMTRDDFIARSGGLTRKADKRNIYVVRASGEVVGTQKSRWLGRRGDIQLRPGDTIVVPLNADRMRPMAFWTGVTQILYQGAISVAAVKTFNN